MFGLLVAAEANAGDTGTINSLLSFAERYREFALDPLPEARILLGVLVALLLIEFIVRVLTTLFGMNRKSWLLAYTQVLPGPINWLIKTKLLQGFQTSATPRSYLHYMVIPPFLVGGLPNGTLRALFYKKETNTPPPCLGTYLVNLDQKQQNGSPASQM